MADAGTVTTITTAAPAATPILAEAHAAPPISGFTTIWGVTINPSVMVLVVILSVVAFVLWKGQRTKGKNTFDIWDLLMDTLPDGSRRASGIKCAFQGGFLVSTWVVVDQQIKGTLSEAIYGLYLGTWCASLIAKVVFDKQDPLKFVTGGPQKEGA